MQPPSAPKKTKNVCAKSKPKQKTSKVNKGKQQLQQKAMTQANPKYIRGQPMLIADQLRDAGRYCVKLYNYIKNYKMSGDIMVQFKDCHFLLGDDIFVITFSNLHDLFTFDALDISLMHRFIL
jgi:hypothetical protein